MSADLPAARCEVSAGEGDGLRLEGRGHGVVPAVEPAEERDHRHELDDLSLVVVLAQLREVLIGGVVGNHRRSIRQAQRGALRIAEERVRVKLEGGGDLLGGGTHPARAG